jgi:diphthamide biosynthesis protein 7
MDDVPVIASTASTTLDLPPSAVQFCAKHAEYFVVATYYLEKTEFTADAPNEDGDDASEPSKKSQSRNGSLLVFKLEGNEMFVAPSSHSSSRLTWLI